MRTNASARANAASSTIAVDLGATAVRVVEMDFDAAGHAKLTRRGSAPVPPGLWNDLSSNREALSNAITQALASAGIAGRAVVACLPRRLVTMRFVRLPHAPPEAMRGMVEFEAQQYVLFPLDDVILDYHVVTTPMDTAGLSADDMDTVLLAAARRSLIDDIMAVFDRAGLELLQLSVSALALAENARDSLEPTALIDVEPGELDVAVVADGQLLFTRASALDVAGVRPEVAERRQVEEVLRSFTSYQNEFRHRPLAHVYIGGESGTGTASEGLQRALTEMLEMAVTPIVPRGVAGGDGEARAWATAIGMTLQSRAGSIAPISLVPNERAMRKAIQARQRRQQLMALGGAAAAVAACFIGWQAYGSAQKNAVLTAAANKDLQAVTDKVKKLRTSHDKVQTIAAEVGSGLDRNHPSVDVLYALNAALPAAADIWLTQFQFERGGLLTLHGETKRALEATQLVLSLQKSGAFTDVRLTYVGDSQDNSPAMNPAPTPAPTVTTISTTAAPVTPTVPILPAPASFGGFPGGANGFNPGAGGRFGGSGQGPTVITPSNGATFTPPNGANFSPPNGGNFNPNNGGNPNFPNGSVSFPAPGGVTPNGAIIQGNIQFSPNNPVQVNPGSQGAPQPFIPPTPIPAPAPGGTSAAPMSRSRQAGLKDGGGNLILAGWQGPVDNGGGNGGNGNGGNGNGGNGNRGGRGGGRRNRGNGGNYPNFDPNATGGNFNPGNNGGNNPGSNPSGSVNSSAPTYSTGSIFGATPSNPNVNTPPDPNASQNPNIPNPNFPGGNRGGRRYFGGGGFGGNPLTAPLTTPPGGIQRVTRKIVTPVRPKTNPPKQTLTSFVITCRVNMKRADLVPAGATIPTSANKPNTDVGSRSGAKRAGGANTAVDNGGDNADNE